MESIIIYPQSVSVCEKSSGCLTLIDVLMNKSKDLIKIVIIKDTNSLHSNNTNAYRKKMFQSPKPLNFITVLKDDLKLKNMHSSQKRNSYGLESNQLTDMKSSILRQRNLIYKHV